MSMGVLRSLEERHTEGAYLAIGLFLLLDRVDGLIDNYGVQLGFMLYISETTMYQEEDTNSTKKSVAL